MALLIQWIMQNLKMGTYTLSYNGANGGLSLGGSASVRQIYTSYFMGSFVLGETVVFNGRLYTIEAIFQDTQGVRYDIGEGGVQQQSCLLSLAQFEGVLSERAEVCVTRRNNIVDYLVALPPTPSPQPGQILVKGPRLGARHVIHQQCKEAKNRLQKLQGLNST